MQEMFEAFKTLVEADASAEKWPVLEWSDDKLAGAQKPTNYIAIADYTPTRNNLRLTHQAGVDGYMFAVTFVGQAMEELRRAIDRVNARIEGRRLSAEGDVSTPLHQDNLSSQPLHPLEDTTNPRLFTALSIWKCAAIHTPPAI